MLSRDSDLFTNDTHSHTLYSHTRTDYLEELLRKQIVAAIGKEVSPVDFAEYMDFHNRRLFRAGFQPRPFS